ncbi:HNH endonuclease [Burkholderia sp. Ac-20345]|nr:HNH endonuclease [Burkholderia sp. Ac-20345]
MISVDRQQEIVAFERVGEPTPISPLDAIQPRRLELIYDLLQRVPIAIDAWHRTKNDRPPKSVKANPKFCYNWSFGTAEEGYAVCFWHDNLDASSAGEVLSETNYRASAQARRRRAEGLPKSDRERARLIAQAERGEALDKALETTYRLGLPLHVILCYRDKSGPRSESEHPSVTSSVKFRELDSLPWSVVAYDKATGACRVVRGGPTRTELHGEEAAAGAKPKERVARYMNVEVRQDQPAFRKSVFDAYGGRCAISDCDIPEALEAAHLHGRDWRAGHNDAADGILLRRDLHALYDRDLLQLAEGIACFDPDVVHHYAHLEGVTVAIHRST